MFDLGPEKVLALLGAALLVLGPERLPHFARTLGQKLEELRTFRAHLLEQAGSAMEGPSSEFRAATDGLRDVARDISGHPPTAAVAAGMSKPPERVSTS